jgi:hypothetical protein
MTEQGSKIVQPENIPVSTIKKPVLAGFLAFFLGPFGFLYLDLRSAIAACIVLTVFYGALEILNAPRVETTAWVLPLICLVMAFEAASICRGRNVAFMVDPANAGKRKRSDPLPSFWTIIIFLIRLTVFYACGLELWLSLRSFGEGRTSRGLMWLGGGSIGFFLGAQLLGLVTSMGLAARLRPGNTAPPSGNGPD